MIKKIRLFKDSSRADIELLFIEASDHQYPVHFHKRFCFGEILSGELTIEYKDKVLEYKKGTIFFIPPNESHSCKITNGQSVTYQVISFKDIEVFIKRISDNDLFSGNPGYKYRNIISLILETQKPETGKTNIIVDSIIKYLDQNYNETANIEVLSEKLGLSPSRIQHVFKEYTGISIGKYILLERIRKSKMLISKNVLSVIAAECGFYDQSHFHRYFKQYTGVTPQNYANSIIYSG